MPRTTLTLLLLLSAAAPGAAQDSATVVPGPRYAAGALRGFLFGREYRDVWTTPVRVEVLDLDGLTPTRANAGRQTRSLRFRGADGQEYVFRSVDKDLTPGTPGNTGGSLARRLRQDMTHAQFPAATVVAGSLLAAAGVPGPTPRLVVMPRSARLGRFAGEFGGMLGTLELRPDEGWRGVGLPPARRLLDTGELLAELDSSAVPVDARTYLRARLMDVLLGDWDRHEGQYRWVLVGAGGGARWVPVPRDRDYAFVAYDGAVPAAARWLGVTGVVRFGADYGRVSQIIRNGDSLDRRMLAGLPRAAWDSVARDLQLRLSDAVIARAVRGMPARHYALRGPRLERALRARRDGLRRVAAGYYARMAGEVEVVGSARADRIQVTRDARGRMQVAMLTGGRVTYRRLFLPEETRQVRLRPGGGADTVTVTGPRGCIWLLVAAGPGDRVVGAGSVRVEGVQGSRGGAE